MLLHGHAWSDSSGKKWWRVSPAVLEAPSQKDHLTSRGQQPGMMGLEREGCVKWQDCEAQAGMQRKQQGEDGAQCRSGCGMHQGDWWTPGSHPETAGKSSFLPWLSYGTRKPKCHKKGHGLCFIIPSFRFPLTVLMNVLEREKEKEEYGMRCVWQGLGKRFSEVERQGMMEEGRGKSCPLLSITRNQQA